MSNASGWPLVTPATISCLAAQSNANQLPTIINTPTIALMEVNDLVNPGVYHSTVVNPGRFTINTPGVYMITISAQVGNIVGSVAWLWARRNGLDVTTSSSNTGIPAAGTTLLEMQWLYRLGAGDYWEFWFASNNLATGLRATPSPGYAPAIPSVTCTFQWVSA